MLPGNEFRTWSNKTYKCRLDAVQDGESLGYFLAWAGPCNDGSDEGEERPPQAIHEVQAALTGGVATFIPLPFIVNASGMTSFAIEVLVSGCCLPPLSAWCLRPGRRRRPVSSSFSQFLDFFNFSRTQGTGHKFCVFGDRCIIAFFVAVPIVTIATIVACILETKIGNTQRNGLKKS